VNPALVFAGPSLHGLPHDFGPDIVLRPPAVAGDIAAAISERPRAIGLIDGLFGSGPTVRHAEILAALDAGIPVLGAASLGAIRAAELRDFGMAGVGAIFEAYASGALVRDDAVLVVHGPAELGYPPLTLALVEAEAAIAHAPLAEPVRMRLLRRARRLTYQERSWAALTEGSAPGTADILAAACPPLKRRDAQALIARLAEPLPPPAPRNPPRFRPTLYTASLASS